MKVRSLFALALAALLAPAATLAAPSRTGPVATTTSSALEIGGFVGYETDDIGGLALRLDGELPFQNLSPQIKMSFVGSLGFSHLSDDFNGFDVAVNIVKLVPAARFTLPLSREFSLFADGGLGLYYASWSMESPDVTILGVTFPGTKIDDSDIGLMMRIGGGAWYQMNANTRIGASLEFDPYFGDVFGPEGQTTFLVQAGAMFRM